MQLRSGEGGTTSPGVQDGARPALERVDVSVGADGQIQMRQQMAAASSSPTGLILVEVQQLKEGVQIEIADFKRNQVSQYRATLPDGKPLPDWIKVDPATGRVTAQPQDRQQTLEIHLIAQDTDGSLRTLVVRMDLSPPKTATETPSASAMPQARMAFMHQIATHHQQWSGYGEKVLSVFTE